MPQKKRQQDDLRDREIQSLRDAQDRMRDRFLVLANLVRRMSRTLDPAEVLQEVVGATCELTQAQYGALGIFNPGGRITSFITQGVSEAERARIGDPPQGLGLLGGLQQWQQPLRLADLSQHPQSIGFPPNYPPMKSFLGVPIRLDEEALGNLYLAQKAGDEEFTPEDEDLLQLLADQAALAINNARLHQLAEGERVRLQTLVDTSPTGVLVVEAGTEQVLLANAEAQRLLRHEFQPGAHVDDYNASVTARHPDGTVAKPEDRPLQRALTRGERVTAQGIRIEYEDGSSILTVVGHHCSGAGVHWDRAAREALSMAKQRRTQPQRSGFGLNDPGLLHPFAHVAVPAVLGSMPPPLAPTDADWQVVRSIEAGAMRARGVRPGVYAPLRGRWLGTYQNSDRSRSWRARAVAASAATSA